jgi:hypothetical protein
MLKIFSLASALIATTTLWGQREPVGVAAGQTARLTVAARPPDSCSGVVKEAGQRMVVQPQAAPDSVAAVSACQTDVEVLAAKSSGGPHEGIQVHGHWTIDVRNPDGTLASHRDFENSLLAGGANVLVNSLSRAGVTGLWRIELNAPGIGCNPSNTFCTIVEPAEISSTADSKNLTLSVPTSGPNIGALVLTGSLTASGSGSIGGVFTALDVCAAGVVPTSCNDSDTPPTGFLHSPIFTQKVLTTAISVVAGQLVQVTVVLSFS